MAEKLFCSTCKKRVTNIKGTAHFACPDCGKQEIIRCLNCRAAAVKYTCPECGFEGPN